MISKILFLTESREDYLADSLLHGLVSLGLEVVDYPRKQILYQGYKESLAVPKLGVRGHGFTLYGLLPNRSVDRTFVIQRLEAECFDLVIIGQIWRQWGQLLDLAPFLQNVPVVLLDGDDDTRLFHQSGTRIRRYGWQPFPLSSRRCLYLKREWRGNSSHDHRYQVLPGSFSIPHEKIRPVNIANKTQRLAKHCVDPEVAEAAGLNTSYAFGSEQAYYDDLSKSFYAVSTKRGGWDCLRHYEIAAAGALPCIRQLETKPDSCAPHGLQAGVNCVSYQNWFDLKRQLQNLDSNPIEYQQLLLSSADWVRRYTTVAAAKRMLDGISSI